jgi:DNA processing protein
MLMTRVAEPGDVDACRLIHTHGARALVERLSDGSGSDHDVHDRHGKVTAWAERLRVAHIDEIEDEARGVDARLLCPGDAEWPIALDDLALLGGGVGERRGGSPFAVWVRGAGELRTLAATSVAIVGARAATAYGEHVAGDIALGCAVEGITIVSGGAYGIDAAAHRGALAARRPTVSVLACGIDRLYPAGHVPMLRHVMEQGCLVSEAAPGCAPTRGRFLVRNRLIAAITGGTVVVEAALRSGSLNTARWADDLGRSVMGVPGPVTSAASRGVHELLRGGSAVLVTAADEVIEHLSPIGTGLAPRREAPASRLDGLSRDARRLLDAVPRFQPASTTSIGLAAGMSRSLVATTLGMLADGGWVERVDVDRWRQIDRS